MDKNQDSVEKVDPTHLANVRTGYQVAVSLWIAESSQIWTRVNVMLAANSILIAAIVVLLTAAPGLSLLAMLLSAAGLIVCVVWFIVIKRDFEYLSYLIMSAREIEERYLAPVETVSRGGALLKNKPVHLVIGGKPHTRRLSWLARRFRDRTAVYAATAVFVVVYVALLLATWL